MLHVPAAHNLPLIFYLCFTLPPTDGLCRDPPCILSEFCARGSLYDVLAAGRQSAAAAAQLTWHRRLSMLLDAALGMLHLHCRTPPIIHRCVYSGAW